MWTQEIMTLLNKISKDILGERRYFTSLDLTSGYWQVYRHAQWMVTHLWHFSSWLKLSWWDCYKKSVSRTLVKCWLTHLIMGVILPIYRRLLFNFARQGWSLRRRNVCSWNPLCSTMKILSQLKVSSHTRRRPAEWSVIQPGLCFKEGPGWYECLKLQPIPVGGPFYTVGMDACCMDDISEYRQIRHWTILVLCTTLILMNMLKCLLPNFQMHGS